MELKGAFRSFARGRGHALYAAGAPVLRALSAHPLGRTAVEGVMRAGGHALLWAFDGRPQGDAASAKAEWERILRGIGLDPKPLVEEGRAEACATCFSKCTLSLKEGDGETCDAVMSINDELLWQLGGKLVMEERLVDEGGKRCVARVDARDDGTLPGERALWCDPSTARAHFDLSARFYDFIMGYFEVPSNRLALRDFEVPEGGTVLELGVGTGLALCELLRRHPTVSVIAVDRSEGMIARARERVEAAGFANRVEFRNADARRTGLPMASVDAVFSSFLLDLLDVEERREVLAEVRRVAKPEAPVRIAVMDAEADAPHDRALSALYNLGYARWNPLWMALFRGYAPHCRPVRLSPLFEEARLTVERRRRSYVTFFPVAIWEVRTPKRAARAVPRRKSA